MAHAVTEKLSSTTDVIGNDSTMAHTVAMASVEAYADAETSINPKR